MRAVAPQPVYLRTFDSVGLVPLGQPCQFALDESPVERDGRDKLHVPNIDGDVPRLSLKIGVRQLPDINRQSHANLPSPGRKGDEPVTKVNCARLAIGWLTTGNRGNQPEIFRPSGNTRMSSLITRGEV